MLDRCKDKDEGKSTTERESLSRSSKVPPRGDEKPLLPEEIVLALWDGAELRMEDPEIQRPNCMKKKAKQSQLIDQSINRTSEYGKSSSLTPTQRKIRTTKKLQRLTTFSTLERNPLSFLRLKTGSLEGDWRDWEEDRVSLSHSLARLDGLETRSPRLSGPKFSSTELKRSISVSKKKLMTEMQADHGHPAQKSALHHDKYALIAWLVEETQQDFEFLLVVFWASRKKILTSKSRQSCRPRKYALDPFQELHNWFELPSPEGFPEVSASSEQLITREFHRAIQYHREQ